MRIERTTLNQSAAGALLAALSRGEQSDVGGFQQNLSDSINATTPRRDTGRRDDGIADDLAQKKQPAERAQRTSRQREDRKDDSPQRAETADRKSLRRSESNVGQQAQTQNKTESQTSTANAAPTPQTEAPSAVGNVEENQQTASPTEAIVGSADANEATLAAGIQAQQQRRAIQTPAGEIAIQAAPEADDAVVADLGVGQIATRTAQRQATIDASAKPQAAQAEEELPAVVGGPRQDLAEAVEKRPQVRPTLLGGNKVTVSNESSVSRDQQAGRITPPGSMVINSHTDTPQQNEARQVLQSLGFQAMGIRADIINMQVVAPLAGEGAVNVDSAEGVRSVQGTAPARIQDSQAALPERQDGAPRAEQDEQIERITRVIRASLSRGGSRINLQLEPVDLGKLRVHMQLRSGELTARFETQNEASKSWLQNGLNQLRETLAGHGIRLVQATVDSNGTESDGAYAGSHSGQETFGQAPSERGREDNSQQPFNSSGQPSGEEDRQPLGTVAAANDRLNVIV